MTTINQVFQATNKLNNMGIDVSDVIDPVVQGFLEEIPQRGENFQKELFGVYGGANNFMVEFAKRTAIRYPPQANEEIDAKSSIAEAGATYLLSRGEMERTFKNFYDYLDFWKKSKIEKRVI